MTAHLQRGTFNIMTMFDELEEYLNKGDPVVREWFLLKSNFWPIFLCTAYLLTMKLIGPAIMRNRKPYEFRKMMIAYNMCLVATYATCVCIMIYCMWHTDNRDFCKNAAITRDNYRYTIVACQWVVYLLKYLEFLDTLFFVLRKKDTQITNLHVVHHTILPFCIWIVFRTEKSGFPIYPFLINSIVHIVMYSYYGLAAMGPRVRKYLWWKRYLTTAQMIQFILVIISFTVVMPLAGCTADKTSYYNSIVLCLLFFVLFYNFYQRSFKPATKPATNGEYHKPQTNGKHNSQKVKCN